ncbi:MAG: hypothetical protein ACREC5_06335 [Thermoplasmata archaeon]
MTDSAGALVAYRLGGTDGARSSHFFQTIFGQNGRSRGYRYRRHGVLDEIPHWRVMRGLIVVREEDRARVVQALRKWTKEVYWWPIPLSARDLRRLSPRP